MEEKLISVIVPIFKVEKYLKRCVDSILAQKYQNLEIILVDDGSPDKCPQMCDEFAKIDSRIKVIHKQNGGLSSARNAGLEVAKGELVGFVDSDDFVEPEMYCELVKKQQRTDADLVYCKYFYDYEEANETIAVDETSLNSLCEERDISHFYYRATTNNVKGGKVVIDGAVMGFVWRILFKREAIGESKFIEGVKFMEDQLFLSGLLAKKDKKIEMVDKHFYHYSIRGGSLVHVRAKAIVKNMKFFLSNMENYLKGSEFERFLPAIEYYCYAECVLAKVTSSEPVNLAEIKQWNTKAKYLANKKLTVGKKQKIKYFLIRHKMYWLLKILYKIK